MSDVLGVERWRMVKDVRKLDRIARLVEKIEAEPQTVIEPAVSVQLGRQQVADELRAILEKD
jgi:hypothetical protein